MADPSGRTAERRAASLQLREQLDPLVAPFGGWESAATRRPLAVTFELVSRDFDRSVDRRYGAFDRTDLPSAERLLARIAAGEPLREDKQELVRRIRRRIHVAADPVDRIRRVNEVRLADPAWFRALRWLDAVIDGPERPPGG